MSEHTDPVPNHRFARYAWITVGYLTLVILWGAWVRITGSGDGCGTDWPTCHGEAFVSPTMVSINTWIEYTHRVTSGIAGPMVLAMLIWAFRAFPKGHRVRWASVGTMFFLLTEAAVGAGLVKFSLVADNASAIRALTASFHLVNTFTLTAFCALAAWWAGGAPVPRWRAANSAKWWLGLALLGLLVVSMTGAITALGDTIFPVQPTDDGSLFSRVREDLSATSHFLVRLRIVHPIVAVAVALYLAIYATVIKLDTDDDATANAAQRVVWLVALQTALGVVNVLLHAPSWMQLIHLLMSIVLWVSTLVLFGRVVATPAAESAASSVHRPRERGAAASG